MSRFSARGVMPACLMPLTGESKPDASGYRQHLHDLANIPRLTGIVVNGHAAEVHALSEDEQVWGIETACEQVGDRIPIIAGIYAESVRHARTMARTAERVGADALLIFPPNSLMFGGNARPELGTDYVKAIAMATSLPLIVFQFPVSTSLSYSLETLVRLCEEIESIAGIKDLVGEPRLHERTIDALHGLARPVNVLTTHSQWLGASLALGARGIISGAGSVIADRQRVLFEAFQQDDGEPSRKQLMQNMSLLVEAFYGAPYVNWQARMKEVLFRFGRMQSPKVFAPLQTITAGDWDRMAALLSAAGLSPQTLYSK